MKKTWSNINSIINRNGKNKKFPDEFIINGIPEKDKTVIANKFNSYFTNIGPELAAGIEIPRNKSFKDYLRQPIMDKFNFKVVSETDIVKAIDDLKSKSSSGCDGISNKLPKLIKCEISHPIKLIFNQSIASGIFPNSLKIAKVIPLYKKGDATNFENYRPIFILPSMSKILEKVMCKQISNYFSDLKLFYQSQYGFRSLHSTEFAALELVERVISELDNNKIPLNIFLDLSKAFDTLDHEILICK